MEHTELLRLMRVFLAMHDRCDREKSTAYKNYGGRGISVCQRWRSSFADFVADMGPRPAGAQLDRINNNGNYEPSNCRWASVAENAMNKRTTRNLTAFGETRHMAEWARLCGVSPSLIHLRLKAGWAVEAAVTTAASLRPNSKLTDRQAEEIKRKHTGGRGQPTALAKEYGVTHRTITNILRGRTFVTLTAT